MMSQEQFMELLQEIFVIGFIIIVWLWRTIKPRILLLDVKRDISAPDSLLYLMIQGAILVAISVIAFTCWNLRGYFNVILFGGMFIAGVSSLFYSIDYIFWAKKVRKPLFRTKNKSKLKRISIALNRWSVKNIITFTVAFIIAIAVGGEEGAGFAAAIVGVLIGNQIGCVLDDFAKMNRVVGGALLAWNLYDFFIIGPTDIGGMVHVKAAFIWGFSLSCIGAVNELAVFRIRKSK